jgi:hypothetical protein
MKTGAVIVEFTCELCDTDVLTVALMFRSYCFKKTDHIYTACLNKEAHMGHYCVTFCDILQYKEIAVARKWCKLP